LLDHIGCVLSRYLKNASNNISGMFYLRTSSLRHKIMQENFGSGGTGSDWEESKPLPHCYTHNYSFGLLSLQTHTLRTLEDYPRKELVCGLVVRAFAS